MLIETKPADDENAPTVRKRPCGAGLWHKPGWAQVPCPRCHASWEVRGPSAARTALLIRKVWPVDRRRRYTAEEIRKLQLPACLGCNVGVVTVRWRDASAPGEPARTRGIR